VSGLRLIAEGDHKIEPVPDSFYCQKTQHPAKLMNPFDYPIEAVCQACSSPILAESFLADWVHFERVAQPLRGCPHVRECRNRIAA
jgi:hypothetical protein